MKLQLLTVDDVTGIYTIKGVKNRMPESACKLAPAAADNFAKWLREYVIVSDMFRSAESSLNAVKSGRGAKAPGFSGHNYGFSIDLDVTATMKKNAFPNKWHMDAWMETYGWFCHRQDSKREREEWHYNFLGIGFDIGKVKTTAGLLEEKIQQNYKFMLDNKDVQRYLQKLKLYGGDIDGVFGPRTKTALQLFQKTWDLPQTGKLDKKTERTLAYVTADIEIVGAV